jgi:hypothetical protein
MDFNGITPYDQLLEKWSPIIDHPELDKINDIQRRRNTAVLLENQKKALREGASDFLTEAPVNAMGGNFANPQVAQGGASTSALAGYDPILISLVRRAMPNVVAYDVASVQPMSAPTGLIFAFRSRYDNQAGLEAMYDEPIASFAGALGSTGVGAGATGFTYTNPFGLGASSGSWNASPDRKDLFNSLINNCSSTTIKRLHSLI